MSSEDSDLTPISEGVEGSAETADDDGFLGKPSSRRTFLKAAALGTAAAAVWQKGPGLRFGPAAAFADDLSALNCTANDVRIPGPAQILNEPCNCSGTFNAQVRFRVVNNTGTTRYCVTAHLCPVTLADGSVFAPGDILIGDVPPKSDAFYTVTINNYPCGQGELCFGARGPEADGGFPKGAPCPAGACCTTISWDVNPGCPTRVLSSKCRHQQICIRGLGHAVVDCDPTTAADEASCAVPCGGTATVRVSTTGGIGPFIYTLDGQTFGPTADLFHDFTVGPITETVILTGTVTDTATNPDCTTSDTTTLTTTPLTASIDVQGGEGCSGLLTLTASADGGTCGSVTWSDETGALENTESDDLIVRIDAETGTLQYRNLDGACHLITAAVDCGDCDASASTAITQCVTTTEGESCA